MVENKQDALLRSYAMLSLLRKNISEMQMQNIIETYVREFHNVLDRLETMGIEVAEFRVPDSEIAPIDTATPVIIPGSGHTHTPHYSKEKYVKKSFILTKLDAILGYFEIITSEKPRRIGFRKDDTDN